MNMKIPDIILEQYILGELPSDRLRAIDAELSSNQMLRARIERIRRSNEEIVDQYAPSSFVESISMKVRNAGCPTGGFGLFRKHIPALGVAAAAVVIIFLFPFSVHHQVVTQTSRTSENQIAVGQSDTIRLKGDESKLFIFRKTNNDPELLTNNAVTHEGDVIQLAFQTVRQYGVILSIDGRGNVTLHYPASSWDSPRIEKGKKTYLERSYQLDNAPQFERFFFITSDVSVNVDYILSRARSFAKDPAKNVSEPLSISGTKESSVILRKE
jgi:hypothetical protein